MPLLAHKQWHTAVLNEENANTLLGTLVGVPGRFFAADFCLLMLAEVVRR